jgi:glycosyltransferase involved in cell wall biosynthesis
MPIQAPAKSSDTPAADRIETLSVCIIAHNEAENIARVLESVTGWAGEMIVLDCDSSDATANIARGMGAEVHRGPNQVPELSMNDSFELASREWILRLDADEVVNPELKREIKTTIERNPLENGFKIPRRSFYFDVPLMHGGNYPDMQLRLFRRGRGRFPTGGLHERMRIDGEVGELRRPFDHFPYPSFDVWLRKFDFYTGIEAARLEEQGIPIDRRTIRRYMITRPLRRWLKRLFLKRGIRDGAPGVLAASFDLIYQVVSFGKYWERTTRHREPGGDTWHGHSEDLA